MTEHPWLGAARLPSKSGRASVPGRAKTCTHQHRRVGALQSSLVPVVRQRASLAYDLAGHPGAMGSAFLEAMTLERLDCASELLDGWSNEETVYEIVVKDAYRTEATQRYIYEQYATELASLHHLEWSEAYRLAASFVSDPDSVFPHGTGGTIDVWLHVNGRPAVMGTSYDEFSPRAHRDWFRLNPPATPEDVEASFHREILRSAMEGAGFAGLESEWWHYEFGTKRWAETYSESLLYPARLPVPEPLRSTPAYRRTAGNSRQPSLISGVAQPFRSARDRSDALLRNSSDHYYARSSHPTVAELEDHLSDEVVNGAFVTTVSSGLAACQTALLSTMGRDEVLIYDSRIYYEVSQELDQLARDFGWKPIQVDFTDFDSLTTTVAQLAGKGRRIGAFYCDSPMNWWLDVIDLASVATIAHAAGAKLVVDITVQPVQPDAVAEADVVVFSLSKYPSLGRTLGGAIATRSDEVRDAVQRRVGRAGNRLSADAAFAISNHVGALHDRMEVLTRKSRAIVDAFGDDDLLRGLRALDAGAAGEFAPGMVVLDFCEPLLAETTQQIVGQNSGRAHNSLHLAYTFGAAMTTVEHFASNPRPVTRNLGLASPSRRVPDGYLRIGIGTEPTARIVADLRSAMQAAAGHVRGEC